MLYLYDKDTINFTNNGEPIRHSYDEHVVRSEGFYLTFKLLLDKNSDYKKVKKEMIVSAETPDGRNQFRVYDIVKRKDHIEVVAVQLMYDLDNKMVNPFKVNNASGTTVINRFVSSFKSSLGAFTLSSSVAETHEFTTNDEDDNTNSFNALEVLNRIANRWDSELLVNGYDIRMVKRLGTRTNALLYEKKNISAFEDESTVRKMVTRIHATSRFTAEGDEDETVISVTVDSPLINEYAQIYEKSFVNNDTRTTQELINWVNLKFSTENVDKPKRNITVSTNIIDGTEIDYGDELVLKYLVHDVDEIIRCVGYDYNPIAETYYSVTLGDWKDSFATTLTGGIVDTTQRQINQIKKNVTHILTNADGYHRNAHGPDPVPNPINGDVWYYFEWDRPNEIELRIFEDGFWVPVPFGTKKEVEAALANAEEAKQTAESAYSDSVAEAERLVTEQTIAFDAQMAIVNAELVDAKADAERANQEIDAAILAAGFSTLAETVTELDALASQAQTDATNAKSGLLAKADKSYTDTELLKRIAKTTYDAKMLSLDSAISGQSLRIKATEDELALTAKTTDVNALKTRMTTAETALSINSSAIALKASQSDLNAAVGRLSTAEASLVVQAGQIASKVSQTDFNAVNGRLSTAESSITQQATEIASKVATTTYNTGMAGKASTSSVTALTTRVTTAESTITQQAGQIASKVAQTDFNALTGRVSGAETTITQQAAAINLRATKSEAQDYAILATKNSGRWTSSYRVNTPTPMNLLEVDGTLLSDEYSYMVSGVITGTGSITGAVVLFVTNRVGTTGSGWTMHVLSEKGKSSNQIEFFIDSNGRPSVRVYNHTTFYVVNVTHTKTYGDIDVSKLLDDSISTVSSSLTVEAGKITSLTTRVTANETLTNTTKQTADGNKTTISNHAGRLTTVETSVNGLNVQVADKVGQAQFTVLSNSVSSVVTDFNNLEIGGRNYLLSNRWGAYGAYNSVPFPSNGGRLITFERRATGGQLAISQTWRYPYGPDVVYTFSGILKINGEAVKNSQWPYQGMSTYQGAVSRFELDDTTGRFVITQKWTSSSQWLMHGSTMLIGNSGDIITIEDFKMERGNKATDWSPAPEDTQSQITQLSTDINLRVTKGELLSQINIQSNNILIQTNKLYLDVGSVIMTTAFVDDLNVKTLSAITANITDIRAQVITTNSIKSTHIESSTALIDKVFATTALINQLTSKTAFITNIKAIEIAADKITTGTLNAANVNIINLNVSKIVGLNSTFIQSNWNSATGGQVQSTGNGITATRTSDGTQTRLSSGVVEFWNSTNNKTGEIGVGYNVSDASITGVAVNLEYGKEFSVRRKVSAGATVFNELFGVDWNLSQFSMRLNMSLHGNDLLAVGKVALTNGINMGYSRIEGATGIDFHSGAFVTGSIQAITNSNIGLFSSGNLVLGVGNRLAGTTEIMRIGSDRIDAYRSMYLNRSNVWDAGQMSFSNASATYGNIVNVTGTNDLGLYSAGALYLGVNGGGNYASPFKLARTLLSLSVNLDMGGKTISNNSDRRMKTRIEPTLIRALSIYRKLSFVDFDWIDQTISSDRQFGLIAQDSPFIGFMSEDGKWNINSSRQTMLNSLGIKELDSNVINLADRVNIMDHRFADELNVVRMVSNNALTKTQELEQRIEDLENEIELLKSA